MVGQRPHLVERLAELLLVQEVERGAQIEPGAVGRDARSSGIAQLNLNTDTIYQWPASRARLTGSFTLTETDDEDDERDDRGSLEASYLVFPWREWFVAGAARFETNESLGLVLRSQAGGARVSFTSDLVLAELRCLPGAEDVRVDAQGHAQLRTGAPEALLRALIARDVPFSNLEVTRASLEDAFLSLTAPAGESGKDVTA